jgi:hypothetical protein
MARMMTDTQAKLLKLLRQSPKNWQQLAPSFSDRAEMNRALMVLLWTCNGCVHITTARAFGSLHHVCKLRPERTLERKCRFYLPDERAV